MMTTNDAAQGVAMPSSSGPSWSPESAPGLGPRTAPSPAAPDEKDWTWVLDRPCPECGYDTSRTDRQRIAVALLATTARWRAALLRTDVAARPTPEVWSVVEYACHVRDVHRIFQGRAALILSQDDALFQNWDQDATAIAGRYWAADPAVVADEIEAAAHLSAAAFAELSERQWRRRGRRSNGSTFTVETLGLYYLHDVQHHLYDIGA